VGLANPGSLILVFFLYRKREKIKPIHWIHEKNPTTKREQTKTKKKEKKKKEKETRAERKSSATIKKKKNANNNCAINFELEREPWQKSNTDSTCNGGVHNIQRSSVSTPRSWRLRYAELSAQAKRCCWHCSRSAAKSESVTAMVSDTAAMVCGRTSRCKL
jgi:hypothetical protein